MAISGECLNLLGVTGAAGVSVGFDDQPIEPLVVPKSYGTKTGQPFNRLLFRNDAGGGIVVTGIVSDGPISDSNSTVLTAIAASLVAITNLLTPGTTITPIAPVNVAIDGGGAGTASLIVAANLLRKAVVLMNLTAGLVYLGVDHDVQAATCMGVSVQYGQFRESYTGDIYGVGSDAAQTVYGYELS